MLGRRYGDFRQFVVKKSVVLDRIETVVGLDEPEAGKEVQVGKVFIEGSHAYIYPACV